MTADIRTFPQLSESISAICAASEDPLIHTAPEWIQGFLELDQTLPSQYSWRFSNEKSFGNQVEGLKNYVALNRIYWTDQARNVEAYSVMSLWRGAERIAFI